MSLAAAIVIALAVLQAPAVSAASTDPVFAVSPCKVGYEWDDKKKKCVRKGLVY